MERRKHTHIGIYGVVIKDEKILLIKKANGPYKGKLDLPGGSLEFGEKPEDKTAIVEDGEDFHLNLDEDASDDATEDSIEENIQESEEKSTEETGYEEELEDNSEEDNQEEEGESE